MTDKINENTTDIGLLEAEVGKKAELCSDLPEDTGITPAVGSSTKASPCDHKHRAVGSASPQAPGESASAGTLSLASRQDHVHPGVSKIIAGTGIGVSPASGRGDVTVTCTGAAAISTKEVTIPAQTITSGSTVTIETWGSKPTVILGLRLTLVARVASGSAAVRVDLFTSPENARFATTSLASIDATSNITVEVPDFFAGFGSWKATDSGIIFGLYNDGPSDVIITSGSIKLYYL